VPESSELVDLLGRIQMEELFYAHDKIAERERLLLTTESPSNAGECVDDHLGLTTTGGAKGHGGAGAPSSFTAPHLNQAPAQTVSSRAPQQQGMTAAAAPPAYATPAPSTPDDHIKVVRIDKTQEPLVRE